MKSNPGITYLKVKIKNLAAEAKIIRREERKCYSASFLRQELRNHRVTVVRDEQRATLLAYAFLRGVPRAVVEAPLNWGANTYLPHCPNYILIRARQMAVKYNEIPGKKIAGVPDARSYDISKAFNVWAGLQKMSFMQIPPKVEANVRPDGYPDI